MRRLVICLDGTWANPRNLTETEHGYSVYKPTNPLKLYRAIKPRADDGVDQISFYDEGVGAVGNAWDKITGGIWGAGFEKNVQDAYRFLVGNYLPGDHVFVFGFSRGAATSRSLCRFIDWVGGLLKKKDAYYIPELFDYYLATRARPGAVAERMAGKGRRRPIQMSAPRRAKIHFLGVFDTVLALGSRAKVLLFHPKQSTAPSLTFHVGPRPPAIVRTARQALAIDERRKDFVPEIWQGPGAPGQSLEQRWFPGVHTNVGGGYEHDGLANVALHWMADEAAAAGLDFDAPFLKKYRAWFGHDRYESLKGLYKIRGARVRDLDAGPDANLELHPSVLKLVGFDSPDRPPYRPKNLYSYLAKHPELCVGLPDDVLRKVRRA